MNQALKTYGNVIELDYQRASRKKSAQKRKLKWNVKRLLCTALIIYLTANFGIWHYKIRKVNAQIEDLEHQKTALELERSRLEEKKELVQGEAYVEGLARKNLGLIKPGEKVIMLAEPGEVMPLERDDNMELYD